MTKAESQFTFEISLSVLNHLGRNLYRSFITVLGEAISNSWDADAQNVWVFLDKENNSLVVKDDGNGMTEKDFQEKFLKIGYTKRKAGTKSDIRNRPFIGRKGIGKLALLSCARKISVLSKKSNSTYIGGVIDNSGLDEAIKSDLTPDQYHLGQIDEALFEEYKKEHQQGTIIYFEDINDGIKNSIDYLTKLIALYFRFSLIDESFKIFVNDQRVTLDYLDELATKTQFVWVIDDINDPFVIEKLNNAKEKSQISPKINIGGFIASVEKPSALKVPGTDEKASIDLFVNGRLRERDILRHITRASLVEPYLYGQIHFNELDSEVDRFTSSREGIVADDPIFKVLLDNLKEILAKVLDDWDIWRVKHKEDGDPDNKRYTEKERKSRGLFNAVAKDYSLPKESEYKKVVDAWVDELAEDAQFNFSSYAECFISENLLRKYIKGKNISLSSDALTERDKRKNSETISKNKANISIEIRRSDDDLCYLSMDFLAYLADNAKDKIKDAGLTRDATEYKPLRDALAHTSLLTDAAKKRLSTVYENIKARLRILLSTE